jgi:hypothetical protein
VVATKGRVQNDTTPSSKGMWPWRMAIPEVTSIFLGPLAYTAFFGHSDVWIQIWTVGTSNTLQTFFDVGTKGRVQKGTTITFKCTIHWRYEHTRDFMNFLHEILHIFWACA